MTRLLLLSSLLIAATGLVTAQTAQHVPGLSTSGLTFIENHGQWDAEAQFLVRTGGLDAWVTSDGLVFDFYQLERQGPHARGQNRFGPERSPILGDRGQPDAERHGHVVRMAFEGARGGTALGELPQSGYRNYFLGNDPDRWASYVPLYGEVVQGLYDGIDMRLYEDQGFLRYDLVVQPGADVSQIRMHLDGADRVSITPDGDLAMQTSLGEVRHAGLLTYQEVDGSREVVPSSFRILGDGIVGFDAEGADPALPLIIDPLIYSSFLGGPAGEDWAEGIALDEDGGYVYVAGSTHDLEFPETTGAYQPTRGAVSNLFVAKLNLDKLEMEFVTIVAGSSDDWWALIALDTAGYPYLAGTTVSADFPTTDGVFQETFHGEWDGVVVKLSKDGGDLLYSTYLGGKDDEAGIRIEGIVVDDSGSAIITGGGDDPSFPTTKDAYSETFSGGWDAFVTKLSPDASSLGYSTFIGGSGQDWGWALVLDAEANVYVSGEAESADFPTTEGAYVNRGSGPDAFVLKMEHDGSDLIYSSVFGGDGYDTLRGLAVDAAGYTHAAGQTQSFDFPTTEGAYLEHNPGGGSSVVATRLAPDGSDLIYSTYIGGSLGETLWDLSVDVDGYAVIAGGTYSPDFPVSANAFDPTYNAGPGGFIDGFIAVVSPDGSQLPYATFLGGEGADEAVDSQLGTNGIIYVAGGTTSGDFPTTAGAYMDEHPGGLWTGFVTALQIPPPISSEGETVAHTVALDAAYPNPFQQQTTIGFTLAEAGEVQLVIYDVLGRQVARLANGDHASGEHSVLLDAAQLAAGTYLVVLRSADMRLAQRITLIR